MIYKINTTFAVIERKIKVVFKIILLYEHL